MDFKNSQTTLRIFKENFKFSSAHFLIFDQNRAEMLHGHNYQVRINLLSNKDLNQTEMGYLVDFSEIKKMVKAKLDTWDEHVLLPAKNPEMIITRKTEGLNVNFRDRFYVFPEKEVILLPVTNTSVEQLSALLAEQFAPVIFQWGFSEIEVEVEETKGQSASFRLQK